MKNIILSMGALVVVAGCSSPEIKIPNNEDLGSARVQSDQGAITHGQLTLLRMERGGAFNLHGKLDRLPAATEFQFVVYPVAECDSAQLTQSSAPILVIGSFKSNASGTAKVEISIPGSAKQASEMAEQCGVVQSAGAVFAKSRMYRGSFFPVK
jgi:hypothetical protein